MIKLWISAVGILCWASTLTPSDAVLFVEPTCSSLTSGYIGRREAVVNNQLRKLSSLKVLGTDGGSSATYAAVYDGILKATGTKPSPKASATFYEAMAAVSQAFYRACHGSSSELVTLDDFSTLVIEYREALGKKEARKLQNIFGKLMCLKDKSRSARSIDSREKRAVYTDIDEFFDCLDGTDLGPIFLNLGGVDYSVAFVIDDTGSMGDEIQAVKCLIRSFLKSERGGPAKYILGTFNDPESATGIFTPRSYQTDSLTDLEQFVTDLNSISVHGGGDGPEYGVRAIKRAIDASIKNVVDADVNFIYSQLLLFTDAPPKDYMDVDSVHYEIPRSDIIISAFLPQHLVSSSPMCGNAYASSTYQNCIRNNVRGYADFVKETDGVLVDSLTRVTNLDEFITQYNFLTGAALRPVSCQATGRKRRSPALPIYSTSVLPVELFSVSELASNIRVVISPGTRVSSLEFTITNPLGVVVKTATIRNIVVHHFEGADAIPGLWNVSANANFTLDVVIENNFAFSTEFLNETTNDPLESLPPSSCAHHLRLAVFTPQLDKLQVTPSQYINVLTSDGVHQRVSLTRCRSYLHGTILVPEKPFYLQFNGVTTAGYSFTATAVRRFVPPPPSLDISLTSNPGQVSPGKSADFIYQLTATNKWPSCTFNIGIEANISLSGVSVTPIPSLVSVGSTSPTTFRVRVSAASGASAGRGRLVLVLKDASGKELLKNSDTIIGVGTSSCPCKNGGTCSTRVIRRRVINVCLCAPGYTGILCERRTAV
jgi:hypothetical protein